ncbi:hypothetical protein J8A87_20045 [Vibrio parahaemolyticus]|uniref:hypothetical protein n=1 Tax=Vibrio parahaemolyticus TaxID=670 RepID=UPI00387B5E5A|nr:hypothetical protein [Vibrio parahaemolyticus]MCF9166752.1 hypothetical protein [Vibrio parahaemolyticus]MDG3409957.1 hypothetical protein [Vibrio parahaemolyticus]
MNILEKISDFLDNLSKKPDMSTYESRQARYKETLPWFAFFTIFMIGIIFLMPMTIDSGNSKSYLGIAYPLMFVTALYTFGTMFIPFMDTYASIDDESFLDKILPLKILKSIKRNHPFNVSYLWFHAIMLAAPIYMVITILYPLYGTYPLMEPSALFFESEKVTSIYEGISIFVMFIYLFGNTREQNYVEFQAKEKKFEEKNILIAKQKITYKHLQLAKVLCILSIMMVVLMNFANMNKNLLETNLPVKYVSESETKIIPYNQINAISSYGSPDIKMYNASLMGDPLAQLILLSEFNEVEYKETPELSKAVAFSVMRGLNEFQSSKARVALMVEKYPILQMNKTHYELFKNQDIDLEIKILDLIYKNDLTALKSELEKHHSEIFISPKDAVKEGKESIAPLSAMTISHMVKSGNFEYEVSYFRTKNRIDYKPKHEAAKEMVKLMKFFESAHRVK